MKMERRGTARESREAKRPKKGIKSTQTPAQYTETGVKEQKAKTDKDKKERFRNAIQFSLDPTPSQKHIFIYLCPTNFRFNYIDSLSGKLPFQTPLFLDIP